MISVYYERLKRVLYGRSQKDASFCEEYYLSLYPDVLDAVKAGMFASGYEHWEKFGKAEGRLSRCMSTSLTAAEQPRINAGQWVDRFVTAAPGSQNVIDLFQGQWSTSFAGESGMSAEPGHADLFNDARIRWALERLGPFQGRTILELGPLEGAHTRMLEELGAESIVAVESNTSAFLKCLCVKEIFGLTKSRFLLGDFNKYLETCSKVDIIVASGVLYHMTDPVGLLRRICDRSDAFLLWTHYYDREIVALREDANRFEPCSLDGAGRLEGARRLYPEQALSWRGFSGGSQSYAVWMERASITAFLDSQGFECEIGFEGQDHPNGPAFALCAKRRKP